METMNKKPVFTVPGTSAVLNFDSGFRHKLLCDGLTFTAGSACAFSCQYCYVESILFRSPHLREVKAAGLSLQDVVIRRLGAVEQLRAALVDKKGRRKFYDPSDTRVLYMSPLVDVAANKALAEETVAACRVILENTYWQIRLLSKSTHIEWVARELVSIRPEWIDRVIFGVSTGIPENMIGIGDFRFVSVGRIIEQGASGVDARTRVLRKLQDSGFRTYGMICPSLPCNNYAEFSARILEDIRAEKCEHVWAEALNARGSAFTRVESALQSAGLSPLAAEYRAVMDSREQWEEYARETFLAHAGNIGGDKLRFLQYTTKTTQPWWGDRKTMGAICLGAGSVGESTLPAIPVAVRYAQPSVL